MPQPEFTTTVTQTYEPRRIIDLLCTGFEGGMTNAWAMVTDYTKPEEVAKPEGWDDEQVYRTYQYPVSAGGAVFIQEVSDEGCEQDADDFWLDDQGERLPVHKLDAESIRKGLELFAQAATRSHYDDWMNENDDAITGDVFIQLCLLGEVRYG